MRPIRWLRRGVILAGMGVAGGALIVTARHLLETPQPLRSALGGDAKIDRKHGGDIYFNVAGDEAADPVVLLHDFYPGASNFEYRHLFPRLAATWRVYAPDWLGFGMSEHPALAYTGEFYANMLLGFLRDVVGRPAVVVGHGRAANIAARAAADAPELFAQLVLVSPDVEAGIQLEPKPAQLLARATQRVSLGLVPYALLSTKPLLRRLARSRSAQTGGDIATEESLDHLYASAHQFGGQHALLALMTGELDLPIQNLFPLLQPPVLLISGGEDHEHSAEAMEDLAVLNPHADLDVLPGAGETAFEDQPALFTESLLAWLAAAPTRQQPHVEESHPQVQADAEADTAEMSGTSEHVPVSPETPDVPEALDTSAAPEAPDDTDEARDPRPQRPTQQTRQAARPSRTNPSPRMKPATPRAKTAHPRSRTTGGTQSAKSGAAGKNEATRRPKTRPDAR
ncbi:MAG TPA: alpha/beta fold hydrolase [Ktedonobacterales bacterium]|nr:alpha/beta fold hydrolase [Ktedonobacterales bacterium]